MFQRKQSLLNPKQRYLQVALNRTVTDAYGIISKLPVSNRIILEAGTPFIKRYGEAGIQNIVSWYRMHQRGQAYVVADLKMMDRGATEVDIAARAGASAAVALGTSPPESLDAFIENCEQRGLDSMIDMMNIEFPIETLSKIKKPPTVVILHRGVDETEKNKEKQIPLNQIRRIKGTYNVMISIAGGDSIREVQRAIFNDADIVVVWKSFYQNTGETAQLASQFLNEIR